jgi:hypothetical protein
LEQLEVSPAIAVVAIDHTLVVAARKDVEQSGFDLRARFAWHTMSSEIGHKAAPLKGLSLYERR